MRKLAAVTAVSAAAVACAGHQPRHAPAAGEVPDFDRVAAHIRASRSQSPAAVPSVPPAITSPTASLPRPARPGGGWARLRQCESGGDYQNRRNPIYHGAYQFDRRTWASVGGVGDPASASPAEQDARALRLYAERGAQPWPVCGRYLP